VLQGPVVVGGQSNNAAYRGPANDKGEGLKVVNSLCLVIPLGYDVSFSIFPIGLLFALKIHMAFIGRLPVGI
jgi:hypothetical protein